ncbi:MAG: hypothetical protein ACXWCY_20425 [Burkholderiales bacterium]
MENTLTKASLEVETAYYRGTNGSSDNNRGLGFQSAFYDQATRTVYLSRFADGRLAPFHLLDGLPPELVLARDEQGYVTHVKASVISGFVRDDQFYTRYEAAAMLRPAPENRLSHADSGTQPRRSRRVSGCVDRVRNLQFGGRHDGACSGRSNGPDRAAERRADQTVMALGGREM